MTQVLELIDLCTDTQLHSAAGLCGMIARHLRCKFVLLAWRVLDRWFIPAIFMDGAISTEFCVMRKPGSANILIGLPQDVAASIDEARAVGHIIENDSAVILYTVADLASESQHASANPQAASSASATYQFTALASLAQLERYDVEQRAKYKAAALISSICHRVRTPLNDILHTARLLVDSAPSPHLDQLYQSAIALTNTMCDIVDMEHLDLGHLQITAAPTDLHALLTSAAAIVRRHVPEHVTFICTTDSSVPQFIDVDSVRVRQVIINLLESGLRHIDPPDDAVEPADFLLLEVCAEFAQLDDVPGDEPAGEAPSDKSATSLAPTFGYSITVTVSDSGHGMTDALRAIVLQAPELLHSFARTAPAHPTLPHQHIGANMRFNHLLAQQLGGMLTITSSSPSGTTVEFEFVAPEVAQPACRDHRTLKTLKHKRALLINNYTHRIGMYRAMVSYGMSCTLAATSREALLLHGDNGYDVIICTVVSHTNVYRSLAKTWPNIPIIAVLEGDLADAPTRHCNEPAMFVLTDKLADFCAVVSPVSELSSFKSELLDVFDMEYGLTQQSMEILIVEDNKTNRILLVRILERKGYKNVSSSSSGTRALAAINKRARKKRPPFDLIISDIRMPRMTGFELARHVRAIHGSGNSKQSGCPLLFGMTAQMIPGNISDGGFDFMISKPIDTDLLDKKIRTAMNAR